MKQWYAVHTKPRRETVAEEHLQRQGFDTYFPRIRLRKRRRNQWVMAVEPLFPRYLFILCDPSVDNTAPVHSTRGAVGLVRIGAELRPVPGEVIQRLRECEDAEDRLHHDDSWPHQPGERVQVLKGPFASMEGVYQMPLGESRAMLLIELLGRENQVAVEMDALAASGDIIC